VRADWQEWRKVLAGLKRMRARMTLYHRAHSIRLDAHPHFLLAAK
jgi:hypothetical protein